MTNPELIDRIILQGRALVRAIEALSTIQPSGPFERALARLLMAAYKPRLRAIAAAAPTWVSKEKYRAMARDDSDFDPIRDAPCFQALVAPAP